LVILFGYPLGFIIFCGLLIGVPIAAMLSKQLPDDPRKAKDVE